MNKAKPYINRLVKIKQQHIQDMSLSRKLQEIKPVIGKYKKYSQITINHSGRQKIREDRETIIQRDNQVLLQKITKVMNKKPAFSTIKLKKAKSKTNKSLNEIYRKHQIEQIQQENRRFLQKLQNKRASLNIEQWQKEWKIKKSTSKRLANVGFHTTNIKSNIRIRSMKNKSTFVKYQKMKLSQQKNIDGFNFQVKIKFVEGKLKIMCQLKERQDIKIIEIPKQEAINFIEKQCNGSFQNLVQKLHYDSEAQNIYIFNECLQEEIQQQFDCNPEINEFAKGLKIQSKQFQNTDDDDRPRAKQHQSQILKTQLLQKREISSQGIEDELYFGQRQPDKITLYIQGKIETAKQETQKQ